MSPNVFCTGTTGYIGGDALFNLINDHQDWHITCLVRNNEKGAKIASQYPKVKLVYGDLDAVDILAEEAGRADIVYHFANCDHQASARAIAKGLVARTEPSYWIHTSGTLSLAWETIDHGCFGEELSKVFDDWDGVGELVCMPDRAAHRAVDKIVLDAASDLVHVAIVCPPTIYGPGRGPDNQRSVQAYEAARVMLQHQRGFLPGKGENIWHEVHVQDLSDLYLLLGEAAAAPGGGNATWGKEDGFYLAENGGFKWGDVLRSMARIAYQKGLLPSDEVPSLSNDELNRLRRHGCLVWGTNSRGRSLRGVQLLGWKPYRPSLMESLEQIVVSEADILSRGEGHAARVVHDLRSATHS